MVLFLVSFHSLVAMLFILPGYLFILRAFWRRTFETYSRLSPYMSSLLWVDDSQLELTLFSLLFPVDC
jgi:hypothetical protein